MTDSQHPVPILLCIDVEPDGFFIDPARRDPWEGFEATFAFVEAQRPRWQPLCGSPVRVTWFLRLDAQIAHVYGDAAWVVRRHEREFATLIAHGDELGLHPHPYRWDRTRQQWILDFGHQPWLTECIESATRTFAAAVGRAPRSFRCGDRFMNQETADVIARLGYDYDLTLEPGHLNEALPYPADQATGRLPDLRGVPSSPCGARRDDYRRPDPAATGGPWTVPITTASARTQRCSDASWTQRVARPTPHLAPPLRTGAMVDGRSGPRITANADRLSRLMRAGPCAVVTLSEAMALLSRAPYACAAPITA